MEIITELNYDWLWWAGGILLIVGIVLLIVSAKVDEDFGFFGVITFVCGILCLVYGCAAHKQFRVKIDDSYTIGKLREQCEYMKYEHKYDTWLVEFKEGEK